jgi:glycosyltransferase involved in cell wall biosynthesis
MSPLISIIIPVYNAESYLRECLDSVVNQTMCDIQIICINDGSTDHSSAILEEYAAQDVRVLIINKENGGVAVARNTAFSHVTGKYILFIDSDDTVDLRLCEKVYLKAEETNADFVLFFHDTPNGHEYICDTSITSNDKITWEEKKTIFNFGTVWGKLWRTDFLKKYELKFYEQIHVFEDTLFYLEGLVLATKVSIVPEFLYHYYTREYSLMNGSGNCLCDIFELWMKFKAFLQKEKLYSLLKTDFLSLELGSIFCRYKKTELEFQLQFIEKAKIFLENEEIQFLRKGRHVPPETIYFYYQITGDRYLFFMYLKKSIQQFPERYIVRPIVKFIKRKLFSSNATTH